MASLAAVSFAPLYRINKQRFVVNGFIRSLLGTSTKNETNSTQSFAEFAKVDRRNENKRLTNFGNFAAS